MYVCAAAKGSEIPEKLYLEPSGDPVVVDRCAKIRTCKLAWVRPLATTQKVLFVQMNFKQRFMDI